MLSNRGPRGVPSRLLVGRFDYLRAPNVEIGAVWVSQSFTASGTFTAPSSGVRLNKRGKIELFISMCAGGGGGGGDPSVTGSARTRGQGGQAGDFVRRHKVEVSPGEIIPYTQGLKGTGGGESQNGTNGSAASFGSYLTLAGGAGGAVGSPDTLIVRGYNPANGGSIISGSLANDNAVFEGAAGGQGMASDSGGAIVNSTAGMACLFLGPYVGPQGGDSSAGGGGGAGLFGSGGTANSGAGGRGGSSAGSGAGGVDGHDGSLLVEWKVAA